MSSSSPLAVPCVCSHSLNWHDESSPSGAAPCTAGSCPCAEFSPVCGAPAPESSDAAGKRCILGAHLMGHHKADMGDGTTYHWTSDGPVTHSAPGVGPRDHQVGGDHYAKRAIQPWDIWDEYEMDPWRANAVKYLLRAGDKGPALEDLKKARHYLDECIAREERRGGE